MIFFVFNTNDHGVEVAFLNVTGWQGQCQEWCDGEAEIQKGRIVHSYIQRIGARFLIFLSAIRLQNL